ncbi:hypothetical protein [Sphingomonas abaci]|uniref:Uncharacterized protein n=1 Tax=Sphingomonas abaci TaxID=237611 RepID=A0A7W7AM96_9SPHN|nr:hypothetical protein [Sphingomonas abaci]MBB4619659.1 hypothetical protein [Sphingomonas abaci]
MIERVARFLYHVVAECGATPKSETEMLQAAYALVKVMRTSSETMQRAGAAFFAEDAPEDNIKAAGIVFAAMMEAELDCWPGWMDEGEEPL